MFWPFVKTAKNGAQTSLYVALDPELVNVTGQYFSDCAFKDVAPAASDDHIARWLWAVSEKWTHVESIDLEQNKNKENVDKKKEDKEQP